MEEVHLSAFDSWRMSPNFANDMFDITKHQKYFSFYLAIFQIEATDHFFKNKVQRQAMFTYS